MWGSCCLFVCFVLFCFVSQYGQNFLQDITSKDIPSSLNVCVPNPCEKTTKKKPTKTGDQCFFLPDIISRSHCFLNIPHSGPMQNELKLESNFHFIYTNTLLPYTSSKQVISFLISCIHNLPTNFPTNRGCYWTDREGLLVGCLTSQQHASVSQGQIYSDNCLCCHTDIEVADQTFYLTQSQYTDTGLTSSSADLRTPDAWLGSHWSANF